ncbi:hypothetical protein XU18_3902 [Perkinsela sp. CCAP 1560/4]|nr:hypothetical protein XU18_3902 [Perkinsela sp. CCAP 1560/4]|eukprot:KNH04973.1 hypothetical protein XU18_3902 [Perkinsela sp. CCAP 1560/4]
MSADASAHKVAGNDAFRQGNFEEAAHHFTAGIEADPENHVLYSNRSACFANLKQWKAALDDAQNCIRYQPDGWAKGYNRLGAAHHGLGELSEALEAYTKSLEYEPDNAHVKEQVCELENALNQQPQAGANPFASLFGPNTFARIQSNPRLAPFLAQPDYVGKINTLIANPAMCQGMMNDQRVMQTMLELMGINASAASAGQPAAAPSTPPASPPKPSKPAEAVKEPSIVAKEAGNAHYKKREFAEALKSYDESIALDPSNGSVYLNRTSVLFEQGKLDECMEEIEELLKKYEAKAVNSPDFVLLSKILTRKAHILQKRGEYASAIDLYQSALRENRNADTLKKLKDCEKEKKATEAAAYIDPGLSAEAKNRGNDFFKGNKYPEAIQEYTEAIRRNPTEHTTYSNRAAAYMKLTAYDDAVRDCEKCLSIEPTFVKAVVRLAHCYFWRKEYHKAIQEYEKGLKMDPANQDCTEGIFRTRAKIMEGMNTGEADEERLARAQSDPEIQGILGDTYMQFVLREMSLNPKTASEYMADPTIAAKVQKLAQAGVISFGPQK